MKCCYFLKLLLKAACCESPLTQLESVPRELPLVGVVREPFTLLIHGHVLRVQDHGKISRLQVSAGILRQYQTKTELVSFIVPEIYIKSPHFQVL